MMGGELGIRLVLDPLLMAERQPEAWAQMQQGLEERRAWSACGVTGAFSCLLPGRPTDHVEEAASVYAELARQRGWLKADRVLDAPEYAALRDAVDDWITRDRTWSDIVDVFG